MNDRSSRTSRRRTAEWQAPGHQAGRWWVLALLLSVLSVGGCESKPELGPAPAGPSGATFSGPKYLYNTVGSMARLSNTKTQIVSGFGLVVGLDGTGSSQVPPQLRQWLINEMTKQGVGRTKYREVLPTSPERLLASTDTAVVRVVGLIPPGAVAGSRFDLLVTAADSDTTSLVGGRLWTTALSAGGVNPERVYLTPLAEGRGPIYMDPRDQPTIDPEDDPFGLDSQDWQALVVAGGRVLDTRQFELVLNQSSRNRADAIGNRINERYPAEPGARRPTANPISPNVVELNIPRRFHHQPEEFVNLVQHTFINRSRAFMRQMSRELAEKLIEDPSQSEPIGYAWRAMGASVANTLVDYYQHPTLHVRLTALEAGAYVGDERTSQFLLTLSQHEDPAVRIRVAEALTHLPESINGGTALHSLLEDPVRSVRIAAYESLAATGHDLVERFEIVDQYGDVKMIVDRVAVSDPFIYITQKQYPRMVIFNPSLGFPPSTLASIWDNRLMIRRDSADTPAELFMQFRDPEKNNQLVTDTFPMDPTVAALIYALAHEPSRGDPQVGFSMTYGQVADAVYRLVEAGAIDAEVEIDRSRLAILLDNIKDGDTTEPAPARPETAPSRPETAASR